MANIEENDIRNDVKGILAGADLTQLSSKQIRKQLEVKYQADLTDRKKQIDGIVLELIEAQDKLTDGTERSNHTVGDVGQVNQDSLETGKNNSCLDTPEDTSPPVKKTKTKKPSVSSEDADTDSDKVNDEQLAQSLQDEENQGRRTRGGKKTPAKKPVKKTKSSDSSKKKSSTYSKECVLSPALAAVMGVDKMKRSDVVKRMWEVVKERDLQDPKNKSFMICDDELYRVFGRKRVKTFGMMKYLTDHIFTPEQYDECFGNS